MEEYNANRYSEETPHTDSGMLPAAPYAVASLVFGIWSILFGFLGFVFSIIGLVLRGKGKNISNYDKRQYKYVGMLKAGRICSIIGLIFSIFWLLCYAYGAFAFILEGLMDSF